MDKVEIGWAAGFFEGEGCVSICKTQRKTVSPYFTPVLNIRQVYIEPLERFQRLFELGNITLVKSNNDKHKDIYSYDVSGADKVAYIMAILLPHLSQRRVDQYVKVLDDMQEWKNSDRERKSWGAPRKTHCKNGHDYTIFGYERSDGKGRNCKECVRLAQQRYRSKNVSSTTV